MELKFVTTGEPTRNSGLKNFREAKVTAPTLYSASKWLNEVFGLDLVGFYDQTAKAWKYDIYWSKTQRDYLNKLKFPNYYAAMDAGFNEAIELIKNCK